jgi:hypothetical protein
MGDLVSEIPFAKGRVKGDFAGARKDHNAAAGEAVGSLDGLNGLNGLNSLNYLCGLAAGNL